MNRLANVIGLNAPFGCSCRSVAPSFFGLRPWEEYLCDLDCSQLDTGCLLAFVLIDKLEINSSLMGIWAFIFTVILFNFLESSVILMTSSF